MDVDEIIKNNDLFNDFVYTPLSLALKILEERKKDVNLISKVHDLLNNNIPELLKNNKCGIMARQIATPNHENKRFISIAKDNSLCPVFLEYFDDKFTSNNKYKHSLGQIKVFKNKNKNGEFTFKKINIVEFNSHNGKKLREVKTVWGESLVDFHKRLFDLSDIKDFHFLNEVDWYEKNDEKLIDFYTNFFILLTCYGILFENFLSSNDSEGDFTRNIVIPTIKKVVELTGVKPLIVPSEPLDMEDEDFWYYHENEIIEKAMKIVCN